MTQTDYGAEPAASDEAAGLPPAPDSDVASLQEWLVTAQDVLNESAAHAGGIVELAVRELTLAVAAFRWTVLAVLVAAGLTLVTWGFALAAAILALTAQGASLPLILLACAGVNLVIVLALLMAMRWLSQFFRFSALLGIMGGRHDSAGQ
tara:strand:- start:128404 stop:128853 length:450 start_codon:yes stop_codon:yes gene_type:complete